MPQMLPDRLLLTVLLACVLWVPMAHADAYADARAELIATYQAGDFQAMRQAAQDALDARPGYPGALFNRALAETLDGDSAAALATLSGLVISGVDFKVADIEEFAPLLTSAAWPSYESAVAALNEPVGSATIAYSQNTENFIPEGIAIGADGELYLGSIHLGLVLRVDDGVEILSDAAGHWSVFGMRLDDRGGLWFASAAVSEFAGSNNRNQGKTGIFRLDLNSNEITHRALLPSSDTAMVLGDLVIVDEDTILATESLTGALYRYAISTEEFVQVVPPGELRSMQGLALDGTGDYLYVSDYVGGLFRVALADYVVERLVANDSITLFGIDGLYRYGNELIAIQNGIRPHRVVALTLSSDGLDITGSRILARNLPEFDEPTLGVVVGDEFFFVANSHWNRFDREGNLPDSLTGPIVLKLSLLERSLERD